MSSSYKRPDTGTGLDNKSLGDKIADIIRVKVIKGEYPQGSRLTEAEFARSFGVSHSCVREAFGILEAEGLVRSIRNKHTEISRFSRQDIEEIYSLRLAIEKLCSEICVNKKCMQMDKLKEHAAKISGMAMVTDVPDAIIKSVEADMAFHETIIFSSRNKRAINVWMAIKYQIETLLYSIVKKASDGFAIVDSQGHYDIINAFEHSDIDRISALLTPHIGSGMRLCMEHAPETDSGMDQTI